MLIKSKNKNHPVEFAGMAHHRFVATKQTIVRIVAQAVQRTLNIYLKSITKSSSQTELLPQAELAKQEEFSAMYLNLLARKDMLKTQKEGRN